MRESKKWDHVHLTVRASADDPVVQSIGKAGAKLGMELTGVTRHKRRKLGLIHVNLRRQGRIQAWEVRELMGRVIRKHRRGVLISAVIDGFPSFPFRPYAPKQRHEYVYAHDQEGRAA